MKYELNSLSQAFHQIADDDIEIMHTDLFVDRQTEITFSVCGKRFPVILFSWDLLPNKSDCIKELHSSIVRPEAVQFADDIGDLLVGRGCDIRLDSHIYSPEADKRFADVSPAMRGAAKELLQWRRRTLGDPGYHVSGDEWEEVAPAVEVPGDRVFLASKNPLDLVELGTSVTKFDNFFKEHFSFKITEKYPGVVLGKNVREQYICTATLGYAMASELLKSGYDSILIADDAVNTRACLIIDPSIIISTLNGQALGERVFTPFPYHMQITAQNRNDEIIQQGVEFDNMVARNEKMEKLSNEIVRASAQLLPVNVDIEPVASASLETLPTGEVHGSYSRDGIKQIVKIALEGDPFKALHHETIHALKEANLFTNKEWLTLETTAKQNGWIGKFGIKKRYPQLQEKELLAESIADGFAYWMSNPGAVKTLVKDTATVPVVSRMFNGFRNLLHKVSTKLGGAGHDTATAISIFSDVSSGKISERESDLVAQNTIVKHTVGVRSSTDSQILYDRKRIQEGKDIETNKNEINESVHEHRRFAFGQVDRESGTTIARWVAEPGGKNSLPSGSAEGVHGDVAPTHDLQRPGDLRKKVDMLKKGGIKTTALNITDQFVQQGWTELRGQEIRNPNDLANIAAIYRSPQFETIRIFLTKDNEIVSHWGITSRVVGGVMVHDNSGKFVPEFIDRMKRYGANQYWLSHNHPSGNSEPSQGDINFTRKIARDISGFSGHVVTNGKVYHLIDEFGNVEKIAYKGSQKNNAHLEATIASPVNNIKIETPQNLCDLTRYLRDDKNQVTLVFLSSWAKVRAVQEVSRKFFENTEQIMPYVKKRMLDFGSDNIFSYSTYSGDDSNIMKTVQTLWDQYLLIDHKSSHSKNTVHKQLVAKSSRDDNDPTLAQKGFQVKETKKIDYHKKVTHVANDCLSM